MFKFIKNLFKAKEHPVEKEIDEIDEDTKKDENIARALSVYEKMPKTWIQYVAHDPSELRYYCLGKKSIETSYMYQFADVIIQLSIDNMGEDLSGDTDEFELDFDKIINDEPAELGEHFKELEELIRNDQLDAYFVNHDVALSSTFINGIMPDGSIEDINDQKTLKRLQWILERYLKTSDPIKRPMTKDYIENKIIEKQSFFNVVCHKCGTPHNFKYDVPHKSLNCTLCDQPLVLYLTELMD
jgi:hypothetical protein